MKDVKQQQKENEPQNNPSSRLYGKEPGEFIGYIDSLSIHSSGPISAGTLTIKYDFQFSFTDYIPVEPENPSSRDFGEEIPKDFIGYAESGDLEFNG